MQQIPTHIAIVMDGNGRWAEQHDLPRAVGHREGLKALSQCIDGCLQSGVKILTVFAFSSENWQRPAEEVASLMELLVHALQKEVSQLHEKGVRICFVGNKQGLAHSVISSMEQAQQLTKNNQGLTLNVCFNYGGRWDIVQAAQQLAASEQSWTQENLAQYLALAYVPDPDLLIRTGGEMRISNYLLWQCAYSELYFSPVLWPDFDLAALQEAILAYSNRERRYGLTSQQIQYLHH